MAHLIIKKSGFDKVKVFKCFPEISQVVKTLTFSTRGTVRPLVRN